VKPVKIYLISPREPSGATWLINCFLELGIKTYRETLGEMWMPIAGGGHVLNPVENHLKKWLPMLSRQQVFHFRRDIEVEWAHHWPHRQHAGHRIVYFVRDPRDALFSRYRRESPDLSFQEFLDFPDPQTLLDKASNWCLYNELWLSQPDIRAFRFEDYKQDARRTLEEVLGYLDMRVDEFALLSALDASAFEKAAEAEKKYRAENPDDVQLINRASQVDNWRVSDDAASNAAIADKAAALLARFGYDAGAGDRAGYSCLPQAEVLRFFRRLAVDDATWRRLREAAPTRALAAGGKQLLLEFMRTLDDALLRRSGLSHHESHTLLRSLDEFAAACPGASLANLDWPRKHRMARLWWRLADFSRSHGLRLPAWVRRGFWRLRGQFRNRILKI
jgi:hypothetical protein